MKAVFGTFFVMFWQIKQYKTKKKKRNIFCFKNILWQQNLHLWYKILNTLKRLAFCGAVLHWTKRCCFEIFFLGGLRFFFNHKFITYKGSLNNFRLLLNCILNHFHKSSFSSGLVNYIVKHPVHFRSLWKVPTENLMPLSQIGYESWLENEDFFLLFCCI